MFLSLNRKTAKHLRIGKQELDDVLRFYSQEKHVKHGKLQNDAFATFRKVFTKTLKPAGRIAALPFSQWLLHLLPDVLETSQVSKSPGFDEAEDEPKRGHDSVCSKRQQRASTTLICPSSKQTVA
mmetsp:Transcript_70125/g.152976  ORF Transcript_70125/g.152976 Transcript_70125/m.152976 type:complete len:125 (+) Transcript_70125:206-580(+)